MPQSSTHDLTARLPAELLSSALDGLSIRELATAMLVSRRWRETALDHPTYWQKIELDTWGKRTGPRWQGKIDFFLLRLARSKGRVLELSLEIVDPDFVDQFGDTLHTLHYALKAHLHHLSYLRIEAHIRYFDAFYCCLNVPAPMLRTLTLSVDLQLPVDNGYTDSLRNPPLPVLRTDIFCSVAPLLREVTLNNIPPPFDLPCFANVERARIGYSTPEDVAVLETDVFKPFFRLRFLALYGQMSLEPSMHPGWQTLDSLELNGLFHTEYRSAPNLKFDRIPTKFIRAVDVDAIGPSEAQTFIDELPGQLELSIASLADHVAGLNALVRPCVDIDSLGNGCFTVHLTSTLPSCALVRGTTYTDDHLEAAGDLFYKASHRLTTLCIPIQVLHDLADYIPPLVALTTLRFIVDKKPDDYDSGQENEYEHEDGYYEDEKNRSPDVWTLAIQRFRILCPALTLLELWFSAKGCRLRCAVVEVVVFVQNTLPESIGPLTLRLYNIDLIGYEDALKPRIARVEHM